MLDPECVPAGVRARATIGACLLTAAGGAMDAWVYLAHGHVFANAQTGNVVLLAAHVAAADYVSALRVVPSILAFIAGLLTSRLFGAVLKRTIANSRSLRLGAECAALVVLASVAGSLPNWVVVACVGFIAAIQITSLSHFGGASFNTGMTTGNLRGLVSAAVAARLDSTDVKDRLKAAVLGWLCLSFPAGALLGAGLEQRAGDDAVFLVAGLVAAALWTMRRLPDPVPDL